MNRKNEIPSTICYENLYFESKLIQIPQDNYRFNFIIQILGETGLVGADYFISPPDEDLSKKNLFLNLKTEMDLNYKENNIFMGSVFSQLNFKDFCSPARNYSSQLEVCSGFIKNQTNDLQKIYEEIVLKTSHALWDTLHEGHMNGVFNREFVFLTENSRHIQKQLQKLPVQFQEKHQLYSQLHKGLGLESPISFNYNSKYEYALCSPETILKLKLNKNLENMLALKNTNLKIKI